jgi:trk system potassium uptake protein TrkA
MQRFAVIGLGRFGAQLARALMRAGAEVCAIDRDHKLIEQIAEEVTLAVRLDSTDEEALRAQGIDKVDAAIVGIGQDFESNILTTVTLKSLGVKYICARAEQETHGKILKRIGADEVIFPEDESAQRWSFKLRAPQISEKVEFAEGFSLAQYTAPVSFSGKTVLDLQLRKKYHVNLIGLRRAADLQAPPEKQIKKQIISVPLPETIINQGDLLWIVGSDDNLAKLPDK